MYVGSRKTAIKINNMISIAVNKYMKACDETSTGGNGDSLNRERVRDIILEVNNLEWSV